MDEHTPRLILKDAYGPTLADLSSSVPSVSEPTQFGADGARPVIKAPVGTGPWVHAEARKEQ